MENIKVKLIWLSLRLTMGWIMLWPFFDKLLGLGHETCFDAKSGQYLGLLCKKAWLAGGSPTYGFLTMGSKGPFAELFKTLADQPLVTWLFMIGLLAVGVCMIAGIGIRIAGFSGALMMLLMFMAVLPPENNPIIDDHIVYAIVFLGLATVRAGHYWGLGDWWSNTGLVKRFPILE